jgi:hypothetical protein
VFGLGRQKVAIATYPGFGSADLFGRTATAFFARRLQSSPSPSGVLPDRVDVAAFGIRNEQVARAAIDVAELLACKSHRRHVGPAFKHLDSAAKSALALLGVRNLD